MNRTEFINWLGLTCFEKKYNNSDTEWRELMNYAEYIWDELVVEADKVIFSWEEWEWGSINYNKKEYTLMLIMYLIQRK